MLWYSYNYEISPLTGHLSVDPRLVLYGTVVSPADDSHEDEGVVLPLHHQRAATVSFTGVLASLPPGTDHVRGEGEGGQHCTTLVRTQHLQSLQLLQDQSRLSSLLSETPASHCGELTGEVLVAWVYNLPLLYPGKDKDFREV